MRSARPTRRAAPGMAPRGHTTPQPGRAIPGAQRRHARLRHTGRTACGDNARRCARAPTSRSVTPGPPGPGRWAPPRRGACQASRRRPQPRGRGEHPTARGCGAVRGRWADAERPHARGRPPPAAASLLRRRRTPRARGGGRRPGITAPASRPNAPRARGRLLQRLPQPLVLGSGSPRGRGPGAGGRPGKRVGGLGRRCGGPWLCRGPNAP